METLKIQVKKDIYNDLVSGKEKTISVDLTQNLAKRASVDGKSDKESLENDKNLLKKFDELYISCMFSADNITLPIKSMEVKDGKLCFSFKSEKKEIKTAKVEEKPKETKKVKVEEKPKAEKKETKDERKIEERIDEILEKFCANKDVFTVNTPRVIVRPNGVLFALGRKLPIDNDVAINIDIERQRFFHTYDMTDDMFIEQLKGFLKKMLVNNYVFIWKSRCKYKVVDGKRFLVMYYTTRRYIKPNKK